MRALIANAKTKASEKWFLHLVRKEKGFRCGFERRYSWGWRRCNTNAPDVCHIISRAQAPAAKHDPRNGLPGCRRCHTEYDQHEPGVRVPFDCWRKAVKAVNERSKIPYLGEWRS